MLTNLYAYSLSCIQVLTNLYAYSLSCTQVLTNLYAYSLSCIQVLTNLYAFEVAVLTSGFQLLLLFIRVVLEHLLTVCGMRTELQQH